jgi:hypothetical protein
MSRKRIAGAVLGCLVILALPPAPAEAERNDRRKPVIFVHGLSREDPPGADCDQFDAMRRAFRRFGHRGGFTSVAYYQRDRDCNHWINHHGGHGRHHPTFHYEGGGHGTDTSIRHLGYHFARFVWSHWSRRGRKVDVVAHSMGGLIVRYALAQTQLDRRGFPPRLLVEDVVTMGTPHGGARAYTGFCRVQDWRQCDQMQAGSEFLVWLEGNGWDPQGAGGTDWSTFGSDDDDAVAADRAAGTARDRDPVSDYIGSCHKVWYRESTNIEHSEFLTITTDRITADVYRRNCPGGWVKDDTSHWPVRRADLAIAFANR